MIPLETRRGRLELFAGAGFAAALVSASACNAFLGIDDVLFSDGAAGFGAGGGHTGNGGDAGSGGAVACDDDGDCTGLTDECNDGVCDTAAGLCVTEPRTEGTACGDDSHSDCSAPDTCDTAGTCQPNHVADGTACDDCVAGPGNCDVCQDGVCLLGTGDCFGVAPIACLETLDSNNGAAGSIALNDTYPSCNPAHDTPGSEIAFTFVADGDGPVVATLTGLDAELDLFVLEDQSGECSVDACVAHSAEDGPSDERLEWAATGGATYYLVVDGRDTTVSDFTLAIEVGDEHVVLSEVQAGSPDFVEIRNRSGCTVDLGAYVIRHQGECDNSPNDFPLPAGTTLAPGNVFRIVDEETGLLPNEVYSGDNICDNARGFGHTLLCLGACDLNSCANVVDFVQRDDGAGGGAPGGPSCAGFDTPVDTTAGSSSYSSHRTGFAGTRPAWLNADWEMAAESRD